MIAILMVPHVVDAGSNSLDNSLHRNSMIGQLRGEIAYEAQSDTAISLHRNGVIEQLRGEIAYEAQSDAANGSLAMTNKPINSESEIADQDAWVQDAIRRQILDSKPVSMNYTEKFLEIERNATGIALRLGN